MSRRHLLAGLGGAAAAALIAPRGLFASGANHALTRSKGTVSATRDVRHLAWVWQFRHDGDPGRVRDTLAAHGLGVALKTHDGPYWMSRYDNRREAVSGPASVAAFANFFEGAGVPFHAWAVVKGNHPVREAQLASDVLNAGARSLFLDVEPHAGFWTGSSADAARYGEQLRRLQPSTRLSTSIDPRPWFLDGIPLGEFAAFTDEIAPQVYWAAFSSAANVRRYITSGHVIGPSGVTPGFVLSSAMNRLRAYGRPIHPIGDGTVPRGSSWSEFVDESFGLQAEAVSVWRYGITDPGVWGLLGEKPARTLGMSTYIVQPGDTLGGIAARSGTSVRAIVDANGIADPNLIGVGMRLNIPGGAAPAPAPVAAVPLYRERAVYVVQPGETLSGIARTHGTTVDALVRANGIRNANLIVVGQRLTIP